MYHAVIIGLGVYEGDGGRKAELADNIEGEFLDDCRGGTASSLDGVLVRGDCLQVLCLAL